MWSFAFFMHFLVSWVFCSLLVYLTAHLWTELLALLLFCFQLMCLFTHFFSFYKSWLLYFQVLLFWEFSLFIDTAILVYIAFSKSRSAKLSILISCLNISFALLFCLSAIISAISRRIYSFWKNKVSKKRANLFRDV